MANLCGNTVVMAGNPEKLARLETIIRKLGAGGKYILPEGICEELNIDVSKKGHSYDTAMGRLDDIDFSTIPEGYLRFYCCSAWGDIRGIWDAICETLDLNGFASLSDADGEYWIVNDPGGIWFPEKLVFDSYGEGTFAELEMDYYNSEEELAEKLNKVSGEEKTFAEWQEYLEDNDDEEGVIRVIDREGNQLLPFRKENV